RRLRCGRGIFGRDRRPRHRRAIRAAPSPLGAERDKNLDQASRWACDSLLSRLACFAMSWLWFHCASMLRLTAPPRSNHLRAAPVSPAPKRPAGFARATAFCAVWGIVARQPAAPPRHIEPGSALVPGPFWCATGLRPRRTASVRGTSERCPSEVARYCSRDRRKGGDRAREKVAMRAGTGARTPGVSEATRPARLGRSRVRPLTNFTF